MMVTEVFLEEKQQSKRFEVAMGLNYSRNRKVSGVTRRPEKKGVLVVAGGGGQGPGREEVVRETGKGHSKVVEFYSKHSGNQ